jgi:hypothetical protein
MFFGMSVTPESDQPAIGRGSAFTPDPIVVAVEAMRV